MPRRWPVRITLGPQELDLTIAALDSHRLYSIATMELPRSHALSDRLWKLKRKMLEAQQATKRTTNSTH